jgi:cellulose synthase operon protein C
MLTALLMFLIAASSDADVATTSVGPRAFASWSRELSRLEHQPSGETIAWLRRCQQARDHDVRAAAVFELGRRVDGVSAAQRSLLGIADGLLLLGPLPADATAMPTLLQPTPGDQGQLLAWHELLVDSDGGFSPARQWLPQQDFRAVAAFAVWSPRSQPARLATGSGGGARLWLNGTTVAQLDVDRPARPDQDHSRIVLRMGWNLVTVELQVRSRGGRLFLRVTDEQGRALPGLRFDRTVKTLSRFSNTALSMNDPTAATMTMDDDRLEGLLRTRAFDHRSQPTVVDVELARRIATRSGPARAVAALAAAREIRSHDGNAARELALLAWQADPTAVDAQLLLFDLAMERDDVGAAREALDTATSVAPNSVMVRRARWALLADRGGRVDVINELKQTSLIAADGDARVQQSRQLRTAGRPSDAHAVLRPDDAPMLERLAAHEDALRAQLRANESPMLSVALRDNLAQQLQWHPSAHTTAQQLASLLPRHEAMALATARTHRYPQRPEPWVLQGELQLMAGDRDGAQRSFSAALEIAPQDQQLRLWRSSLRDQAEPLLAYLDGPMPPRSAPADEGARIARHATVVRFYDNGLGRIIEDTIIDINDDRAAQALRGFRFGYQDSREELDVLVAQRWRGDAHSNGEVRHSGGDGGGRGMYQDGQSVTVSFADVRPGDRLRLQVRRSLVGDQNWFGDFFGHLIPIADSLPTTQWLAVVEAPSHRSLHWGGLGSPAPTITQQGDIAIHRFERSDVPAVRSEPNAPPSAELTPTLSVSTYDSWQEMGAWYANFIAPQLVLDDELRAIAATAKAQAKDEAELVRSLYEHVVTNTRYVGIELGVHGWKPYPVTTIYRRKFGDCKDKASLLVSLLREAGVAANIALVRTQHQGAIATAPASMWLFDHAIAYVPSLDLFLDGTAEFSGVAELPAMDQGAMTLIVGAHGNQPASELRTIPIGSADSNRNLSDYVLTLAADGSMTIHGKERFRGVGAARERQRLLDEGNRIRELQEQLSSTMPGIVVQQLNTTGLALHDAELGYDFVATVPRWAKRVGTTMTMPLSLYPHRLVENHAATSSRTTDLIIDHPWQTINRMRYVLPPGWKVQLPPSETVDGGTLQFRSTVSVTHDGFVVEEDTAMTDRRILASDYPAFYRGAQRADGLMSRTIELEVKP